jgi:hypothetical protein
MILFIFLLKIYLLILLKQIISTIFFISSCISFLSVLIKEEIELDISDVCSLWGVKKSTIYKVFRDILENKLISFEQCLHLFNEYSEDWKIIIK